ncbi:hypothetical protein I9018_24530 [Pseudomonas sp. MPFS]|uniref:hypothetical protein n=1 Tax=Pseudomonas sp. MPFS TaxID=2795724 RepID=UPI001F139D4B|nr:hypothetical protein [Pseudomonas sp. MPFS]UMZ10627.1 hypothetical protein I9018_24530 [Pseudomonas sp. MPFS]
MDLFNISNQLDRAKRLSSSNDEADFKYACLELRFCLEIVAYRQLEQYDDVIPGVLANEWRADKIIKTLASFDPTSDQSGDISIGEGTDPDVLPEIWHSIGTVQSIKWKKFQKYYNKLGSFLHAPKDPAASPPNNSSLDEIIRELERVTASTAIVAFKNVRHADCPKCGNKVYAGDGEFEGNEIVVCGNNKCGQLFQKMIDEQGNKVLTIVDTIFFKCACDARIPVRLDTIWKPFNCGACFKKFRVSLGCSAIVELD